MKHKAKLFSVVLASIAALTLTAGLAPAAGSLEGQALGGGAPIANSTVTLWAASAHALGKLPWTVSEAED